jgi:hypothetical protein
MRRLFLSLRNHNALFLNYNAKLFPLRVINFSILHLFDTIMQEKVCLITI